MQQLEDPCHADPSRHRRLGRGRFEEPWHVEEKIDTSEANATLRGGRAHDCLTSAEVGGLTLAMLHWMFTDWRLGRSESKSRPARAPRPPRPCASQEQRAARELRRGLGVCDPQR